MVAPAIIAALIGAAGSIASSKMQGDAAKKLAPLEALQNINPAQSLQGLQTDFNVPGMQSAGGNMALLKSLLG